MRQTLALLMLMAVATLVAPACTTNPATGQSSFTAFMSPEDEKRVGAQEHPKLVRQFGGDYQDGNLSAYVNRVGQAVARFAEVQDVPYTFTVLDDDAINAFALPGGYVHVTRGLLTLASNEAELAGVLGHEIGHVTARHAAQRYSSATAADLGIGVLSILGAVAGLPSQLTQAAGSGLQAGAAIYLQKYSRDQEMEADGIGIRYMTQAGYDPEAMVTFFRKLDAWTRLEASTVGDASAEDRFDIMASHPRTGDRVQQATKVAASASRPGEKKLDQDAYLKAFDGVLFGDSPAQGFRRGRDFIHPELRIAFTVPPGFVLKNNAQQVVALGPNGALVVFDMERRDEIVRQVPDMPTYLARTWASNVQLTGIQGLNIDGAEAATGVARLQTRGGAAIVRLVAIRGGPDRIWRFAFLASPADAQRLQGEFQQTAMSFRRLSAEQAAAARPWRIDVVMVQGGDTPERLAERMVMDAYRLETFLALNGLSAGARLTPGQQVKIVVG